MASIFPRRSPTLTVLPTLKGRVGIKGRKIAIMPITARLTKKRTRRMTRLFMPNCSRAVATTITNKMMEMILLTVETVCGFKANLSSRSLSSLDPCLITIKPTTRINKAITKCCPCEAIKSPIALYFSNVPSIIPSFYFKAFFIRLSTLALAASRLSPRISAFAMAHL